MTTITHGCSFTRYKWPCWPSYLSWFNGGIALKNKGRPGSGNETISRSAIHSAMSDKQIDHLYIMWSGTDRYEVVTKDKITDWTKGLATYNEWDDDFQWSTWYGGHPDRIKHNYFRRYFWDELHQYYRTLEHIHRTQLFLDKKQIPYTMMVFNKHVLRDNLPPHSKSERALHESINWSKFLFYKERQGLWEFSEDHYKEYYLKGETHPPPIAHYHWVKDIIYKSDIRCPDEEYDKLKDYFKGKDGRS